MRALEELKRDVGRYTLDTVIHRTIVFTAADIPRLERENERDLELVKDKSNTMEATVALFRINERTGIIRRIEETVAKGGDNVSLPQTEGGSDLDALRAHVIGKWTVAEVLFFRSFTRGGRFTSPKGWTVDIAGYYADTSDAQTNLVRLFEGLSDEIFLLMGAMAYTGTTPDKMKLGNMTMKELRTLLPDEPTWADLGQLAQMLANMGNAVNDTKNNVRAMRQEMDARLPPQKKKPTMFNKWPVVMAVAKRLLGDLAPTERTIRNWIRDGHAAKVELAISWDNLTTLEAWHAWLESYKSLIISKESIGNIVTEKAGQVAMEKARRGRSTQ